MDRHVQSRLKREKVIWLVTASRDGKPQAVPVWFVWDGEAFLIYAQDGVKVRHVKANPAVELHLNSDEAGDDIVRISGRAEVPRTQAPADKEPDFLRKYRADIKGIGMTPQEFAAKYRHPIRVRRLRFH